MLLTRDGKFIRTDIWREGKYLDLWSVPHFLSGMIVGFSLFFLGFAVNAAFTIAFLLLVAYEMFEVIAQIEETRWNRVLDVVVGMASFAPTFLLAPYGREPYIVIVFIIIIVMDGVLSFFGWQASQKAATLEGKLRAEVMREKERFTKRRAVFRERWQARRDRRREER